MRRARPHHILLGLLAFFSAAVLADILLPPPMDRLGTPSVLVTDREGRALRAFPAEEGRWRFAARLESIDPLFIEALVRVEDKRFWQHGGTDWPAMARAAFDSLRAGRIVSGGSTLTMQTARLLEPRPRTPLAKLIEIARARQLERRFSKEEILELYLTLAPYGGNLEGVRAASWSYFGHEADRLTQDEIALLIALPQSPEARRPDRRPAEAARARNWVAGKLARYGVFAPEEAAELADLPVPARREDFPARAWHGAAAALAAGPRADVRSTLDIPLQAEIERIALERAEAEGAAVQVAILVVHIRTRAVRAAAGSASRDRPGGWIDLTGRARSPGSTLKPFIYALAFDDGSAAADTRIEDLPRRFAAYQPENFDRLFRGDVRVSDALQHSLNLPAVMVLERIGPERFSAELALAGARPRLASGAGRESGLALALGGAGMTARELAVLYAALGDGGAAKPLVWRAEDEAASARAPGHRLMSPASAAEIRRILAGTPAPAGRLPGRLTQQAPEIAFKTGTSYGFRDAWAAGLAGEHAFIVWAGRADGTPRPGVTGREAALPILFEVADRAAHHLRDDGEAASRLSAVRNPRAPAPQREFAAGRAPEILFPPQDAELWAGEVDGRPPRPFILAGRGAGRLAWYVDGVPVAEDASGAPAWQPEAEGFYLISAVDSQGRASRARVRVLTRPPA